MTDEHIKKVRELVAEVDRRKACTHPKRTPSRAAGSYSHDKGPVEVCDTCGATCYWGRPVPVDDSHLEVSVPGEALSALLAERDALKAENARLREALTRIVEPSSSSDPRWWRKIADTALKETQG